MASVSIQRRGEAWEARWRDDGRRHRSKAFRFSRYGTEKKALKAAQRFARDTEKALEEGSYVDADKSKTPRRGRLKRTRTLVLYRSTWARYVAPVPGRKVSSLGLPAQTVRQVV